MEGLTRLVSESLARHGFDRPLDYRRLRWSRWFRCDSHHSLLFVPSKPGVFALAEEIVSGFTGTPNLGMLRTPTTAAEGYDFSRAESLAHNFSAPTAEDTADDRPTDSVRRMLAVTQFFEDEDMAFVLNRMMSHPNSMNARLASGRYFARFVVIEDQTQRRSICNALNQWIASAAEKATGIGSHFASSLELTPATEYVPPITAKQESLAWTTSPTTAGGANTASQVSTSPQLDSGAATNIHCPSPFPSGF